MRMITVQECSAGSRLLDVIFKPFVSGEKLASRPNYGRTTEMYSWERCAKFWELNKDREQKDAKKTTLFPAGKASGS